MPKKPAPSSGVDRAARSADAPSGVDRAARSADAPSDAALERVRAICFRFAGVEEKLSHGTPSFFVRKKMFVMFADDHHGDGRVAVWCKAEHAAQRRLVAEDPRRYFVPPYVGVKGWVGVRLDGDAASSIDLAILVEAGWASVVPKGIATEAPRPPPKAPPRAKTDPDVARATLARLTSICEELPESSHERDGRHTTFRVRNKTFAYHLDNHHGDGVVGVCVKTAKGENDALAKRDPDRFFLPPYIGPRGWVGIRVDRGRVDWKDVAARVIESYRTVAPKRLVAAR